ncbi:MAG: efflux RND transporter periplasmic adaptor subunit [Akkermansiaceae bacterium]
MKLLLKIIIPLLILFAAVGIFKWLGTLKPPVKNKPPVVVIPDAEIVQVSAEDHSPAVLSFGTVQPYFETILTPQVSGRIEEIVKEFRVGKQVKKGTLLARIDTTDYDAALAREQANLATAKRTLAEEEVRSGQAAEDWEASGRKIENASRFVLRKPQLEAAKSAILSSEAAVQKAVADVSRTEIRAPYDAIITERNASEGNLANPQSALGRLIATERAEIRLPFTAEQTSRITLPTPGETQKKPIQVTLTTPKQPDVKWIAEVVRTEPTIDPRNQVTFAIAEISTPYADDKPTLAVGTFVNASMPGNPISNTLRVPESALVNDAWVWSVNSENKLTQLKVTRFYSLDGDAYIRLNDPDAKMPLRIVVRPLTNFRQQMEVNPITKPSDS